MKNTYCTVPGLAHYRGWRTFVVAGKKFLCLELSSSGSKYHILDEDMNNHGAWWDLENFKDWRRAGKNTII